jgi:anti-anti-sigma regulatory factor
MAMVPQAAVTTLRFDGVINAVRRPELRTAFSAALHADHVLVDVSEASCSDATLGLELLLLSQRMDAHGRLTVVTTSAAMNDAMSGLGLGERTRIVTVIA